jgi:hypothetical protein
LRPSSVEAPLQNGFANFPQDQNGTGMLNGFADTTLDGERFPAEAASSFHEHNLRNITATTMQEPELDVDEELAYLDEYADVKVRLRKKPGEKEKKKVKKGEKASTLCEVRDKKMEVNFYSIVGNAFVQFRKDSRRWARITTSIRTICPSTSTPSFSLVVCALLDRHLII